MKFNLSEGYIMSKTIQVFEDAGHGWAKVPISELKSLDIKNQITSFSYVKDGFAYLEENKDFGTYLKVLKESEPNLSLKFEHDYYDGQSEIRTYKRYNKNKL